MRDFRKMLEVLGVRWKYLAHFCYGGGSALGVRESALPMTGVCEKCALQRTSVQQGCSEHKFLFMCNLSN